MITRPKLNLQGLTETGHVVYPHTRVGMVFYPQKTDEFAGIKLNGNILNRPNKSIPVVWDAKKTHGSLQNFIWQKKLGQPAAQWQAIIKDPARYSMDIEAGDILSGDWVDITIIRNGMQFPLGRGRVENVRRQTRSERGAKVIIWQISGRDHGGILEYPIAYTNMWARKLEECVGGFFTRRIRGSIGGSPSRMFADLIKASLAPGTESSVWLLPPSMVSALQNQGILTSSSNNPGIYDLLTISVGATRGGYFNEPVLWASGGQGIMDLLNQWCNPLLNEMIFDAIPLSTVSSAGTPTSFSSDAYIRERPFVIGDSALEFTDSSGAQIKSGNDSPWFKLPTIKIPYWIVLNDDVGMSDSERFNLIQLLANIGWGGSETDQQAESKPLWLKQSIQYHGLRLLQQKSQYCADARQGKGMGDWINEWKSWQTLLSHWYCLNPYFYQGTIDFKLALPEVRIGTRLLLEGGKASENWTYYVEGIMINYRVGDSAKEAPQADTQLQVTRGWKGSDQDLLKAVQYSSFQYAQI